jgi:ADP-L-glycero-D-manno-heptose 6-epimerase
VTGSPAPVTIPFPDDLRGQYQDYTCADITRLRKAGWTQPFLSLEEGIAAYWKALSSP